MMPIVVNDQNTRRLALELKAAIDTRVTGKRLRDHIEGHAQLKPDGHGRKRVVDVVEAGPVQLHITDRLFALPDRESRTERAVEANRVRRDVGLRAQAV